MGCSSSKATTPAAAPREGADKERQPAGAPKAERKAERRPDRIPADQPVLAAKYQREIHEDYNLGKVLGKGQFGTTRIAISTHTGEKFACKTIPKRKLTKAEDREDVHREVAIMDHLNGHGNIVELKGVYETAQDVHIVMELCSGGELFDRIVARGNYSERSAAHIIREIVEVVAHCHTMGVIHRDLKPENFLLTSAASAAKLKAIDFGLSTFFKPDDQLTDIVGSAYYVAPEVLRRNYSSQCDIWSCGVILYILLSGTPPFYAETEVGIFKAVLRESVDFESHPWPLISNQAKDCVRRMLERDVDRRATAEQILQHPWMADNGVATDAPLHNEIQERLQQFNALNRFKRQALFMLAACMPPEEVEGLRNKFQAMDQDGNGTITAEELRGAMTAHMRGDQTLSREVMDMLGNLDLNASGAVDYNEFLAATLHASKLCIDTHLQRVFKTFDEDDSGTITKDELERALRSVQGFHEDELEDIIEKVDLNHDGVVDYEEFCLMMTPQTDGPVRRRMTHKVVT